MAARKVKKGIEQGKQFTKEKWNKAKTKKWSVTYTVLEVKPASRKRKKKSKVGDAEAAKPRKTAKTQRRGKAATKPKAKPTKSRSKSLAGKAKTASKAKR